MKQPSQLSVILYVLCAVVWTIRAIIEVAYKTYNDSIFWFAINMVCAVMWIVVSIVNLKRYRSNKHE